jgi:general nucleoside transport system permease protein
VLNIFATVIASALAGALWVLIPAWARAYHGANELVLTLLFNFIANFLLMHMMADALRDRSLGYQIATPRLSYNLPILIGDRVHLGLLVPILLSLLIGLLLRYTKIGYELGVIGESRRSAKYIGLPVHRYIFISMLLSGAIAGVTGLFNLAGSSYRLTSDITATTYGYSGFLVAALAGFDPFGVLITSMLFGMLIVSGSALQAQGFTIYLVTATTGLILLLTIIGQEISHYRIVPRKISKASEE